MNIQLTLVVTDITGVSRRISYRPVAPGLHPGKIIPVGAFHDAREKFLKDVPLHP